MDIRNRMSDVVKLRCNVCQDFLSLVIEPGWQIQLYDIAKKAIKDPRYADKYIPAYEKMRDVGVNNYEIEDMDVTFITQVVQSCKEVVKVNNKTKDALIKLRNDRNLTNHSTENEEAEELYLRGLLSLCNLQSFVRTVDKVETGIDDKLRLEYRNKYLSQIETLKKLLDEERILLIQREKDINDDINRILESDDRDRTWNYIFGLYMEKYLKLEKNYNRFYEFIIKASDAGIINAHSLAADYYFSIKKDYTEGENRLRMMLNGVDKLSPYEGKSIIDLINFYLMEGNELTKDMAKFVELIIKQGYSVTKKENDIYQWEKNE